MHSPWNEQDLWWVNAEWVRVLEFSDGGEGWAVSVSRDGGWWRLRIRESVITAKAVRLADGELRVSLDGVLRNVVACVDHHVVTLRMDGATWRLTLVDRLEAAEEEEDAADRLVAPIPGQVTQVAVGAGDSVVRGQVLVVLEAMKTVFRLSAPADRVVAAVSCAAGEMVQEGQVLVAFAEAEAEAEAVTDS